MSYPFFNNASFPIKWQAMSICLLTSIIKLLIVSSVGLSPILKQWIWISSSKYGARYDEVVWQLSPIPVQTTIGVRFCIGDSWEISLLKHKSMFKITRNLIRNMSHDQQISCNKKVHKLKCQKIDDKLLNRYMLFRYFIGRCVFIIHPKLDLVNFAVRPILFTKSCSSLNRIYSKKCKREKFQWTKRYKPKIHP